MSLFNYSYCPYIQPVHGQVLPSTGDHNDHLFEQPRPTVKILEISIINGVSIPSVNECIISINSTLQISVIFSLVSPEITHPTHNITENPIILEDFHETIECVATGLPVPEVYWIKSTNISERIGTSSIEITSVLLTEPTNVFYCIAVNSLGMGVVSLTYQITVETALDNVQEKLDNSTSITSEEAATIAESILSSVQTSSEMEVLTKSVGLIEQVVDQVNGTFSNETTQIITEILDIVITSSDRLEYPKTVSQLIREYTLLTTTTIDYYVFHNS